MNKFTEISGTFQFLSRQANQKLQFLQDSYPTASHCIIGTNILHLSNLDQEFFQLKGQPSKISITLRLRGRQNKPPNRVALIIKEVKVVGGKEKELYVQLSPIAASNPAAKFQRRRTHQACRQPYLYPP